MHIAHIISQQALTVFAPTGIITVHAEDDRFEDAVDFVSDGDLDGLIDLVKPIELIRDYLANNDRVYIAENTVYLDDEPVNNYMGSRIMQHFRDGNPVEPLINFMVKVQDNPSRRAQTELLGFLEFGELPITPSGNFLAYKKVGGSRNRGYFDSYTGTIDNSIGAKVSMPRNGVQDDPNITCSYGLHFCSVEYVRNFYGDHLMVLEINPRDVVSIPTDYNNTKGRCCAYTVVGELDSCPTDSNHWGKSLVDEYEPTEPEPAEEEEVAEETLWVELGDDEAFNAIFGFYMDGDDDDADGYGS